MEVNLKEIKRDVYLNRLISRKITSISVDKEKFYDVTGSFDVESRIINIIISFDVLKSVFNLYLFFNFYDKMYSS